MMLDQGTQMKIGAPVCAVGIVFGMFMPIYACFYRKRIFKRKTVSAKIRRRADTDTSYTSQWLKRYGTLEPGMELQRQPSYMSTRTREQYTSVEIFGLYPDYSVESDGVEADYSTTDDVSVHPDYSVEGLENKSENPDYSFDGMNYGLPANNSFQRTFNRDQSETPDYSLGALERKRIQSENRDFVSSVWNDRVSHIKYNNHRGQGHTDDGGSAFRLGQLSTFATPFPDYD